MDSAVYDPPNMNYPYILIKTNKVKYAIRSFHLKLVSLTEGVLEEGLKERLIENRSVHLQGG